MAVANLHKDQASDHCARIAHFAIAAIEAANSTVITHENGDTERINIRVGYWLVSPDHLLTINSIHCGPVVSNVVGTKNPRYCLFGDTLVLVDKASSNLPQSQYCKSNGKQFSEEPHSPLRISRKNFAKTRSNVVIDFSRYD